MGEARQDAVTLSCELSAPSAARQFVRGLVIDSTVLDNIELLVSEVVTNAVLHAQTPVLLTIRAGRHETRVEVTDDSPLTLSRDTHRVDGGRGLRLLDILATRWGVDEREDGKTVWFEIANE